MIRLAMASTLAGAAALALPLAGAGTALAHESHHAHESHQDGRGSLVYAPVYAPVNQNVCGNTVNTVGLLNPAFGNTCISQSGTRNNAQPQGSSGEFNPTVSSLPELPSPT
jgi:hypothetical protein